MPEHVILARTRFGHGWKTFEFGCRQMNPNNPQVSTQFNCVAIFFLNLKKFKTRSGGIIYGVCWQDLI